MGISLPVPDYTTVCRRGRRLQVLVREVAAQTNRGGVEVILDARELRVDGRGTQRERLYGERERRRWVKVHMAMDGAGGVVLSVVVKGNDVADGSVVAEVMGGVNVAVRRVIADGGYDWGSVYEALMRHSRGCRL